MTRTARALLALTAGLLGCAPPRVPPPRLLLEAQATLARAHADPWADSIQDALTQAEAALTQAERAYAAHPHSVQTMDDAYVALRTAELACSAARYAAARQALDKARTAVLRLHDAWRRRQQVAADTARQRRINAYAQKALRRAHRTLLEAVRSPGAEILEHADELVLRLPMDQVFLPGTSIFRGGVDTRLARLAHALVLGPPFQMRLQVAAHGTGLRLPPAALAARRFQRLRHALRAHGLPTGAFLSPARRPPAGTQVDLILRVPPLDGARGP